MRAGLRLGDSRTGRWSLRLLLVALLSFGVVLSGPVAQAVDAVTVTATPSTVVPANTLDLRAGIPVANASGLASQEIVQVIDPTKITLRSRYDITAPAGWTLSYSTDGVNFTAPEPTSEAGWALIKGVKAQGQVETQGSLDGRQVTSKTAVDNTAPTGVFVGASRSGDGWDVFFDDRGYVFNVFHHDGNGGVGNGAIDCHTRSGANCPGSWPYALSFNNMHTPQNSSGWYDPTTRRAWLNINTNSQAGFVCLNLSDMTAANKWCGGSYFTAFVGLEWFSMQAGYAYNGSCSNEPYYYTCVNQMVESGGRLFAWNGRTNHLLCLDTRAPGPGAACSGQPVVFPGVTEADWGHHPLVEWQGRIYGTPGYGQAGALCVVAATLGACPGWTGAAANLRSFSPLPRAARVTLLPDAQGATVGVCYLLTNGAMTCVNAAGATITPPAAFVTAFSSGQLYHRIGQVNAAQVSGSRLYWGNGGYDVNGQIYCWDMALNAGAGGYCTNWGGSAGKADLNYTAVLDPVNNNCLWTNDDGGEIRTWDTVTATVGCTTMSTTVNFSTDALVPRMGCDASTAIGGWRQIKLNGPAVYTGATLTVTTETGAPIAGWANIAIPGSASAGTAIVDLTALDPGVSGQNPNFSVSFATRGGNDPASATITAVGDAPQLCLEPTAVLTCPTAMGPIDDSEVLGSMSTVTGSGASTLSGGSRIDMTSDVETVTVTSTPKALCGSLLTGIATEYGASTAPIPGVVATLINSATGLPVRDASNNPVTVTTGADGSYSFGYLAPGSYKVSFASPSSGTGYVARTATTSAGATGTSYGVTNATGSGSAAVALSNTVALAVGADGIVNSDYVIPVIATPDTSTNGLGLLQTKAVTSNDSLSTGGSSPSIKLCTAGQTPNGCTGATTGAYYVVSGQGYYSYVNSTTLSFQPCISAGNPAGASCTGPFTGTASPATYQVTDSSGTTSSSTYTPTVVPAPTLSPDVNSGPYDTNQLISPLTNDSAASATTLVPTSIRLCSSGQVSPNCTATTVTVAGEGTYTLSTTTGVVTFDPLPTFTGTATPVSYTVADAFGVMSTSTITPTVVPPPLGSATADTTSGFANIAQSKSVLANDTVPTGLTLTTSSLRLCGTGQVSPNCTATSVIVPGQGAYTVNTTTGVVTFTPCTASGSPAGYSCTGSFLGTATPATYQVSDSAGRAISSTYTPTFIGPSSATADISSGAFQATQTISPLGNDSAGVGTTIVESSVKLCTTATATASCTGTTLSIANQGTYTANTDGTVTFAPCTAVGVPLASCTQAFIGTATPIKYTLTDAAGQVVTSTITPTVVPPAADVASPDSTLGKQGAAQAINPLLNDTTPAGVTFTASTVKLCTGAQVVPDCTGTSLIVAGKGVYTVNVLTGEITFTPCNTTAGGLVINGVTYASACTGTPFTGVAPAATYQVSDSLSRTVSSTYTPTVVPMPTATADVSTGAFQATQTITPLSNDLPGSGTSINPASVRLCMTGTAAASCTGTSLSISGEGTYTVNTTSGVVTFVPDDSFTGTATPIQYKVTDLVGQSVTSTITPTVTPPPVDIANPDSTSGRQGDAQSVNPLTNDTTPSGVTLVASSVKLCATGQVSPNCTALSVIDPGKGVYTVEPSTGVITFTPCDTSAGGITVGGSTYAVGCSGTPFSGAANAADYQVTDSIGRKVSSTYTPTVIPAPTVNPDTSTGSFGAPQTISVLGNDAANAATSLDPTSVKLCSGAQVAPNCTASTLATASGTYTVNANGTVTFQPCTAAGSPNSSCTGPFSGTAPAVSYQVSDALGQAASSTITPTVTAPAPPVAAGQSIVVTGGGSGTFTTISGTGGLATPGAGALSSVRLCQVDDPATIGTNEAQSPPNCTATTVVTSSGTYVVDPVTGIVTYTNTDGSAGAKTGVTYQVTDVNNQTASAVLTPTVPPQPTSLPDVSAGQQGSTQTIAPTGNDSPGASTAPLVPSSIKLCSSSETPNNCNSTTVTNSAGTYVVQPDGTVAFTPINANYTGTAPAVPYIVSDSLGQKSSSTITVIVLPQPAPVATNDAGSAAYGQQVTLTPMGNDSPGTVPAPVTSGTQTITTGTPTLDASSLKLCAASESVPDCSTTTVTTADGTYVLSGSSVVFTPVSGFTGTVTSPVPYQVSNTFTRTTIDTAADVVTTVTVDPSSTCTSASYCAYIAANDANGVAPGGTGYIPTWTKTQSTASVVTDHATVSAFLIPTIGPPAPAAAVPDSRTGLVNTSTTVSPLANDTNGAKYPLNTASLRLCDISSNPAQTVGAANCTATTVTVPGQGTYVLDPATGVVIFTPIAGFTGTATPLPYVVADTQGTQVDSTITITINAPAAANDSSYGVAGTTQTLDILANDSAASGTGTTLIASSVKLCGPGEIQPLCSKTSLSTADGTYTVNPSTGAVTFVPNPAFTSGAATVPVRYVVTDSAGQTATATITPNVVSPPTPVAANDIKYAPSGSTITFNPFANDTAGVGGVDPTGAVAFTSPTLTNSSVRLCSSGEADPNCTATTLTTADGTYVVNANGTVTFTPASGFTGTAAFPVTYQIANSYSVTDNGTTTANQTKSASATLTPVIVPPPTPSAANDSGTALVGQTITFTPWANDTVLATTTTGTVTYASNGLTHPSVRLCSTGQVPPNCTATTLTTVDGTYVVNADGTVTFTGALGFVGPATVPPTYQITDPYTVTNSDGATTASASAIAIALLIPTLNTYVPPVALPDSGSGFSGTPVTVITPGNDATATINSGATYPLDLTSVKLCAAADTAPNCTVTAAGSVILPGQGIFTITNAATGEVTFTPCTIAGTPAGASCTADWSGTVQVPYSIADTQGNLARSTVTVTITPATPPSAVNDSTTTPFNTPVTLPTLSNDTNGTYPVAASSAKLCGVTETAPVCTQTSVTTSQGTFTINPSTGSVSFSPVTGFVGTATIDYSVNDGHGASAYAQESVTVLPPTGPVAVNDAVTTPLDTPVNISPLGNDSAGGTPLATSPIALCAAGEAAPACTQMTVTTSDGTFVLDPTSNVVTFTPAAGFTGVASVPYSVLDTYGLTASAVISVTISPSALPQVSSRGPVTALEQPVVTPVSALPPTTVAAPTALLRPQGNATYVNPERASILDPLSASVPSPGQSFMPNTVQLWNGKGWVTSVKTPGVGRWTVIAGRVEFMPARGYVGNAWVPVRARDSGGITVQSTLMVQVKPRVTRLSAPGDVPSIIRAGVTRLPAQCPSAKIGGNPVASITVDGVTVPIVSVNYPAGGVLEPPATNRNAAVSSRHASLDATSGTSVLVWHVRYGPGCWGTLNVLLDQRVGSTFTVRTPQSNTTYAITARKTVKQGRYPASWFAQGGEHRLVLFTCTGLVNGEYTRTVATFAQPVSASASTPTSSANPAN